MGGGTEDGEMQQEKRRVCRRGGLGTGGNRSIPGVEGRIRVEKEHRKIEVPPTNLVAFKIWRS